MGSAISKHRRRKASAEAASSILAALVQSKLPVGSDIGKHQDNANVKYQTIITIESTCGDQPELGFPFNIAFDYFTSAPEFEPEFPFNIDIELFTKAPAAMETPRLDLPLNIDGDPSTSEPAAPTPTVEEVEEQQLQSPPPNEAPSPEFQCLACCAEITKADRDSGKAIQPCHVCNNYYCPPCLKGMFVDACKDMTRMPPRCCSMIHLHFVRHLLSKEEVAEFRVKFEEWSTPKPFYCPVPTCSVFIPERLFPRQPTQNKKGKRRADSGIGTPTSDNFACPKCEADICISCRGRAHPGTICTEFGIDENTANLLKAWGYKRCPKCGHGLKRMYGCDHMECRCGAHFCWKCLKNRDDCEGNCEGSDDEDDYSEPDDDTEPDNEEASTSETEGSTQEQADNVDTPTRPIRIRNLDGGAAHYWEAQDMDFGDEPANDDQDRVWQCYHIFSYVSISYQEALSRPAYEMECMRCWRTIHPEIRIPSSVTSKATLVPGWASEHSSGGTGGRGGGSGRGRFTAPRRLFRSDATVGSVFSPLSQSVPSSGPSLMDNTTSVLDTYGNIITTTEVDPRRRASFDDLDLMEMDSDASAVDFKSTNAQLQPLTFTNKQSPSFSFAHECNSCDIMVCDSCKDDVLARVREREDDEDGDEEDEEKLSEAESREETSEGTQEEQQQEQTQTEPQNDAQDQDQDAVYASDSEESQYNPID